MYSIAVNVAVIAILYSALANVWYKRYELVVCLVQLICVTLIGLWLILLLRVSGGVVLSNRGETLAALAMGMSLGLAIGTYRAGKRHKQAQQAKPTQP